MANNADAIDLMNEVERLRAALEGQPVIKSEWEEKCAEVERLRADLVRVANAAGVETPLQLTAIAETDEETTADLLVKHIERLRVGVETLHNTVAVQKRELDGLEAKNERLRAIKRSDTEMIEECRKELAELANNRDGLEHDWSERGASIDAALGQLSVMRCECKPPKGPMCDRHLLERTLKGQP